MTLSKQISNESVADVFQAYPEKVKAKLLELRQYILDTAQNLDGVGEIEETLKWGQPSYLTRKPKTGTTIRIDAVKNNPEQYAMYFHCQTNLIDTFKQMYAGKFKFQGKRGIIFQLEDTLPEKQLCHCIALALTYHLYK